MGPEKLPPNETERRFVMELNAEQIMAVIQSYLFEASTYDKRFQNHRINIALRKARMIEEDSANELSDGETKEVTMDQETARQFFNRIRGFSRYVSALLENSYSTMAITGDSFHNVASEEYGIHVTAKLRATLNSILPEEVDTPHDRQWLEGES